MPACRLLFGFLALSILQVQFSLVVCIAIKEAAPVTGGDREIQSTMVHPVQGITAPAAHPTEARVVARATTNTDLYASTDPYNPYSYSIPDWYTDYSIPTYSLPSYSIPSYSFDIPTYTPPSITVPEYSYPTVGSGGGGGGKSTDALPEITKEMGKVNWRKIIGAVVGSVTGFVGLLGGIWAGCKRKMKKAARGTDEEKYTLHGHIPSEVPSLVYQPNAGFGTVNEPLLSGNYYAQHHTRFQSEHYMPTHF